MVNGLLAEFPAELRDDDTTQKLCTEIITGHQSDVLVVIKEFLDADPIAKEVILDELKRIRNAISALGRELGAKEAKRKAAFDEAHAICEFGVQELLTARKPDQSLAEEIRECYSRYLAIVGRAAALEDVLGSELMIADTATPSPPTDDFELNTNPSFTTDSPVSSMNLAEEYPQGTAGRKPDSPLAKNQPSKTGVNDSSIEDACTEGINALIGKDPSKGNETRNISPIPPTVSVDDQRKALVARLKREEAAKKGKRKTWRQWLQFWK